MTVTKRHAKPVVADIVRKVTSKLLVSLLNEGWNWCRYSYLYCEFLKYVNTTTRQFNCLRHFMSVRRVNKLHVSLFGTVNLTS